MVIRFTNPGNPVDPCLMLMLELIAFWATYASNQDGSCILGDKNTTKL